MIAAQKIANEARKPFTQPGAKIVPQNQTAYLGTTKPIGHSGQGGSEVSGSRHHRQSHHKAKNPNDLTEEEQVRAQSDPPRLAVPCRVVLYRVVVL